MPQYCWDTSGTCFVKHIVCLVIDEAHRAMGNYSYCVAVRELMAVPVQLRILALTATPGSKQQTIQKVIDNLNISTLEYRNESDPDVSPYVHNRKLELVQVAMGKDATEINNLLLEVIRPFVARLCAIGVLYNRDFQTLSPCELLNSRDKFRQAPPTAVPHTKYGEVEGYFGVLITLYHIRKLLSSHGIRPAYEMLEEKLKHGASSRLLSRNEVIWKAKLQMERSLSHGAPNPKLSKMMEILTDHFKSNDPKNSRVIIFSNFRGSVRDIMDSLSKIGELVKATQFIGQSSGKALKGQTQKVQQAVLQKFRAGGYNVIVATSIGEEGLDIMEVDLVICFDANISPLRMIQRMGRTGRKQDGRVVVLACEGSELKGYLRKQANSKTVRKHMRNGGMHSFDFHSSPRMIPHICKPEVQFVELSIEQYVPRGRNVKDDPEHTSSFIDKISDAEAELIAKYFNASTMGTWRSSLIAFPNFQAFPSPMNKVMHSFRTGMLIDAMQHLRGLSFSKDIKTPLDEGAVSPCQLLKADNVTVTEYEKDGKDSISIQIYPEAHTHTDISDEASPQGTTRRKEEIYKPDFLAQKPPPHCFLFAADFVSIDAHGRVLIASVPVLPLVRKASSSETVKSDSKELLSCMKQDPSHMIASGDHSEAHIQTKPNFINSAETKCINQDSELNSCLGNFNDSRENSLHGLKSTVLRTPKPHRMFAVNSEDITLVTPDTAKRLPTLSANESSSDCRDVELSPRLTNLMERGVVPESPIGDCSHLEENMVCINFQCEDEFCRGHRKCSPDVEEKTVNNSTVLSAKISDCEGRKNCFLAPECVSPAKFCTDFSSKSSNFEGNLKVKMNIGPSSKAYVSASSSDSKIQTPVCKMRNSTNAEGCMSGSPVNEAIHTPLVKLTNSSCSKDWCLSSGEASKNFQQTRKFKRLRKYGDFGGKMPSKATKENYKGPIKNLGRSFSKSRPPKHIKGKQKELFTHAKDFIEEEAEVSSEVEVFDDEEDDRDNSSYDDSFIDDRINPTAGSTQAAVGVDMMAIYRRSLLSQSPRENQLNCLTNFSPDSLQSPRAAESGSCSSGKVKYSLQTPQTGLHSGNLSDGSNSVSYQMGLEKNSLGIVPGETDSMQREEESKIERRKRKLSFIQVGSVTKSCLQQEGLFQSLATGTTSLDVQAARDDTNGDTFDDDQFYEGLDFDAMEAQAAELLQLKPEVPSQGRQMVNLNPCIEEGHSLNSPSFDLGI
ncbi:DEAD-box ATP-dependent RNA helicase FANCM isoform X2 [Telopea speciosissima]|uniref:DEAD-box ATP-dependent RNA helicase FANCM isoform X2 n=1 Tax=Telopea speciosissima TaxID=54955 RepID=UPI001CC59290|nr:DEAD-box ATP-dependent RNA helicase FANCM isoform X2 [Telopea speciosissima]